MLFFVCALLSYGKILSEVFLFRTLNSFLSLFL